MVTVIGYQVRQSTEGKSYVSLQLQGDVVFVQSMNTGRHYATVKKCFLYSTFDEETAKTLVGKQLPLNHSSLQERKHSRSINPLQTN